MKNRIEKKQKMMTACFLILLTILLLGCAADLEEKAPQPPAEHLSAPVENNTHDEQSIAQDVEDDADDAQSLAQDYAEYIEEVMAEDDIPGVAVAIVKGNEIILEAGFGFRDVENDLPVTPDTLFHIGSTHKSITSMLIAALIDEGMLAWDMPVVEIYPEFSLSSPQATEAVTMRHLLSMQSGIPDDAEDDFDSDYATAEDVFEVVADTPLLGMPGEAFSYSNLSASIAGYIGVLAAGEADNSLYDGYEQLLQTYVLDPIGMKTAVMRASAAQDNPNYGKSYILDVAGTAVVAESEDYDEDPLAPSGALKASVADMARYLSTQINRGQAPNGTQVVSEANLMETWKPVLEDYGMGWEVSQYEDVTLISHEGAFDNYLSIIGLLPDQEIGFVILTNSEEAGGRLIDEGPQALIELLLVDE